MSNETIIREVAYKHNIGCHCISTGMMNLLKFYGLSLSEEVVFGIGAGLGFTYIRGLGRDTLVFGRSDDLEINLSQMLNIRFNVRQDNDVKKSWHAVKQMIDEGNPVLVDVNASRLNYIRENLAWPEEASHGGHKVVVTGYGEHQIKVYDYLWTQPINISKDEFFYAWQTDSENTPSNNTYYEMHMPVTNVSIERAIKRGMALNCIRMKNPWNKFHGLLGLKAFLKEVPNWSYFMSEEKRQKTAYASYIALEVAGTGRGCFRRMFSRFLSEAAAILKEEQLLVYADRYKKLARLWSELAVLLEEGSRDANKGIFSKEKSVEILTEEIYRQEEQLINELEAITLMWLRGGVK